MCVDRTGAGTRSSVRLGTDLATGKHVAVKVIFGVRASARVRYCHP
jgi:hypothetical protein